MFDQGQAGLGASAPAAIESQLGPRCLRRGTVHQWSLRAGLGGHAVLVAIYGWNVLLAVAVALPIALVGLLIAEAERASGRAWLSGARRIEGNERGPRQTAARGGRYASWIWLANGLALLVATVASEVAG